VRAEEQKMVYIEGGGQQKPRIKAKGKVTFLKCPEGVKSDGQKGIFDRLEMSVMLKQGTSRETTEMLYISVGDVDFSAPDFAALKKIDSLLGKGPEDRKYPIIEFEFYYSEKPATDKQTGEPLYDNVEKEINGQKRIVMVPKMSAKDCKKMKIIAEDSDAPVWFKSEKKESEGDFSKGTLN
jgi:hypothetical protein